MLRTCISIHRMLHSCHRMLVVSASACVLLRVHLFHLDLLMRLLHVVLPLCWESPHYPSWDQALLSCCASLCCLGCYPVALFVIELSLNVSRLVVVVELRYHEKLQPVVCTQFCLLDSNVGRLKALITMVDRLKLNMYLNIYILFIYFSIYVHIVF